MKNEELLALRFEMAKLWYDEDDPPFCCIDLLDHERKLVVEALRAASPVAEAEPVAWRWRPGPDCAWIYNDTQDDKLQKGFSGSIEEQPLYAACVNADGLPDGGTPSEQSEFGWLIEHGESPASQPRYWAAGQIDPQRSSAWTENHMHAIRFARKLDAERVAKRTMKTIAVRIAEHAWATPSARGTEG